MSMTPPQDNRELTHPKYRPDIDGLRAIAVLLVIGFHAFPYSVRGGFIGVDIFFVISGYLISTIIFENLERGNFSFLVFYSRRVKRIFPALLVVLTAVLIFGRFALDFNEIRRLGWHVSAGAGFFSDFQLSDKRGYFDASATGNPLLHLWSLSVEEQYYLIWPLILWLSWNSKRRVVLVTATLLLASFALNIWLSYENTDADFYSPLTRFYELLTGSCLAYATLFNKSALSMIKWKNESIQSFVGVLLLLTGLAFIRSTSAFPGWWSLLLTCGTALIIAAGRRAWFNRVILSGKTAVWFGLISYPLYLWNWPLISFATAVADGNPTRLVRVSAIAVSIVLAWLTYRFMERPVRFGKYSNVLAVYALGGMVAIGIAGPIVSARPALMLTPSQAAVSEKLMQIEDLGNDFKKLYGACFRYQVQQTVSMFLENNCLDLKDKKAKTVFLIGDSFSASLSLGLRPIVEKNNMNFLQVSTGWCEPTSTDDSNRKCKDINKMVLDKVGAIKPYCVVLNANWLIASNPPFLKANGNFKAAILAYVSALEDRGVTKIIVVGQVPTWNGALPHLLLKNFVGRNLPIPARTVVGLNQESIKMDSEMRAVRYPAGATYISLTDALCNDAGCLTSIGPDLGKDLVVWDYGHLTPAASNFVVTKLLSEKVVQDQLS